MSGQSNSLYKNSIALYIRMFFSVCVNVYISRVILDVLGVEDFGIYNVVGGIVAFLGFINSSMAGSTSRFLSVAIGENNETKLLNTYNAAKHLHLGVAVFIFLLGETIGIWIINSYLELPEGRVFAANIIYQLSLATILVTIVQVPFSALIISMEKMDVYAKIEIANVLMKLSIVTILPFCIFDRLLVYPILLLLVAIVIYLIYKYYCKGSYQSLKYERTIRLEMIRPMLVYSGWDMLGWGGVSMSTQGRQILINKFFGVALNAANGLATTASAAIQAFTNNVIMAFRPRIMKCYASHDYVEMQRLTELALVGTIFLMSLIFVPMILCMDLLLHIWLNELPGFTLIFCRLLLVLQFMEAINTVVKIGIQSTGILKNFTIAGFLIHATNLVLTFTLYRVGMSADSTYFVAITLCVINILANMFFLKKLIPQLNIISLIKICFVWLFICGSGFAVAHYTTRVFDKDALLSFLIVLLANTSVIVLLTILCYPSIVRQVSHNIFNRKQSDEDSIG